MEVVIPVDRHPAAPPPGPWVMVQRWHDLLFAHWRCDVHELRPIVPQPLEIETFDGAAWIAVVPFYMSGVRMRAAPPIPTMHAFPEINVRTYVTLDGRPGVWFFSLDCTSSLAVLGARVGVHLPYYRAAIAMTKEGPAIHYRSERWRMAGKAAAFEATYQASGEVFIPAPDTLEHFLTERYSMYAADEKRLWRGDIVHPRWNLQRASSTISRNSMIAAAGLGARDHDPLLHFAAFQDVRLWRPVRVR